MGCENLEVLGSPCWDTVASDCLASPNTMCLSGDPRAGVVGGDACGLAMKPKLLDLETLGLGVTESPCLLYKMPLNSAADGEELGDHRWTGVCLL